MINFHSLTGSATFFLQEKILPTLTVQQKKILMIVSAALACLVACYVIQRCCFQAKKRAETKKAEDSPGVAKAAEKLKQDRLLLMEEKTLSNGTIEEGILQKSEALASNKSKKEVKRGGSAVEPQVAPPMDSAEVENEELSFPEKKIHSNGIIEEGTFNEEGKLEGLGRRTQWDGMTQTGTFKEGKLEGPGVILCTRAKKQFKIVGNYKEDQFYGDIKVFSINGSLVFEGFIENGQILTGKGISFADDDSIEEGTFKNNKLEGSGKRTLRDGTIEEGTFKRGKLEGQGIIILSDGTIQHGTFKRGKLEGQGTIILPDVTIQQGKFEEGVFKGN